MIFRLAWLIIYLCIMDRKCLPEGTIISATHSHKFDTGQKRVIFGSDPDYSMGQWVIQVSDIDPVATLVCMSVHCLGCLDVHDYLYHIAIV